MLNLPTSIKGLANMKEFKINVLELPAVVDKITAGDKIFLSGTVYTARDAAHKKILELIETGAKLPFNLENSAIYYAGPTPAPNGLPIGSCGPTTSSRMNPYAPTLINLGVRCIIGKGEIGDEVSKALVENKALYLCAIGGAGALAASCITSSEVVAFEELGCESIKRLTIKNFPLFCGVDCKGGNLFKR